MQREDDLEKQRHFGNVITGKYLMMDRMMKWERRMTWDVTMGG